MSRPGIPATLLAGLAAALASACSDPGPVTINAPLQTNYVEYRPNGIQVDESLEILQAARTRAETAAAIDRISRESLPDYNWSRLWDELSRSDILERMDDADLHALFSLHSRACETQSDAFESFARMVLKTGKGLPFVTGDLRRCLGPLPTPLVGRYQRQLFDRFKTAPDAASAAELASGLAQFTVIESSNQPGKSDRIEALQAAEWKQVAEVLAENGRREKLAELIDAHVRLQGGASLGFVASLASTLIRDEKNFEAQLQRLGGTLPLKLLAEIDRERLKTLPGVKITRALELAVHAATADIPDAASHLDRWEELWTRLHAFRRFTATIEELRRESAARARSLPDEAALLSALERVHRHFESSLLLHPDDALDFIKDRDGSSPDGAWLKYRIVSQAGAGSESPPEINSDFEPRLPTEKIVHSRLKIHLASGDEARRTRIAEHCELLEKSGLPGDRILLEAARSRNFSPFASPGCHRLDVDGSALPLTLEFGTREGTTDKEEDGAIVMSYDSVVIAPGIDFSIRASSFDGSVFDLGAIQSKPPRELPALPREAHAAIVPLVVGVHLETEADGLSPAVYFFPFHYAIRKAASGESYRNDLKPDGSPAAEPGYPGGNLAIRVRQSESSVLPASTSTGGPGQMWKEPVLAGGRGASSNYNISNLRAWHEETKAGKLVGFENLQLRFFSQLTHQQLNTLIENGARVVQGDSDSANSSLKIIVEEHFLERIGASNREAIQAECNERGISEPRSCIQTLAAEAMRKQVIPEVRQALSEKRRAEKYGASSDRTIELPAGNPSSPLTPGPQGSAGQAIQTRLEE